MRWVLLSLAIFLANGALISKDEKEAYKVYRAVPESKEHLNALTDLYRMSTELEVRFIQ